MTRNKTSLLVAGALLTVLTASPSVAGEPEQSPLEDPELKLEFDTVQYVNSVSENVVVVGTLECSEPVEDVIVHVNVTQDQEPYDEYADGGTIVDCEDVERWMVFTYHGEFDGSRLGLDGTATYDADGDGEADATAARSDTADAIPCTRIGSLGDDRLRGRTGTDRICGLDGADTLIGRGGSDVLRGGPGADSMRGNGDGDILLGGLGEDGLDGGAGDDILNGDQQDDYLYGGPGKDRCNGGPGRDRQRAC